MSGGVVLSDVRTRYPWQSRAFDLAITALLLPLIVPIALLVAVAVAVDSPGPILYRSPRVGRDGRRFEMLKFRTMRHGVSGPSVSTEGDSRYTPFGRLLATMRLDELPQAWNVLRGQMRLVGPRPEVESYVLDQPDAYRRILAVPPGLTGPTQLEFADEGRRLAAAADPDLAYRRELLPRKVALDMRYVAGASVSGDLRTVARTFRVPIRQLVRAVEETGQTDARTRLSAARPAMLASAAAAMLILFVAQSTSL
jgi:lipopolysaccharide/colanic/teichoic acid biosynthesis glycosyltransferase